MKFNNIPINLQKPSKEFQVALFLIAGIVSAMIFFLMVYLPQQAKISTAQAAYALQQQKLQLVESFARSHPNAQQYLSGLDADIVTVKKLLPNDTQMSVLLLDMQQAVKHAGISLVSVKPQKVVGKLGYRENPIDVQIHGSYFNVLKFFSYLENNTRFNQVNRLAIEAGKDGRLVGKLTVTFFDFAPKSTGKPVVQPKKG